MMDEIDIEDIIECKCFILMCKAIDGRVFTDRVYRSKDVAQKRVDYMNKISSGRGEWCLVNSELGS